MRSAALLSSLPLLLVVVSLGPARADNLLNCGTVPLLVERLHGAHVEYDKPQAEVDRRVVELYLERIDPSKSLLLESEAKEVEAALAQAVKDARDGRCMVLDSLHQRRLSWHRAMEKYVRGAVKAPGFGLKKDVELIVDPDDRARPKTDAERNDLRDKLIQFQLANYLVTGTELAEAKKRLVHRYELITKRISELTPADIYSDFLDTMATALDPHTTYFSQDALEDFRISMALSLEGIGAVLTSRDGYTIINEIVKGGAADREGTLKAKDKIIAVAQGPKAEAVQTIDMALRDVVRMIRGKKGTKVTLTIMRKAEKVETFNVTIVRDKIDLAESAADLRWEERTVDGRKLKLAILDLPSFYGGSSPGSRQCAEDVEKLLAKAKAEGADGLLLDLSKNGGGVLQHAVDITGFFLGSGAVVATEGPDSPREALEDRDPRVQWDGPLVVLLSRASASASEILAGAMKDYRRAVLVGDTQTFGKGTVQKIVSLPPGFGALKVTTSLFFRPGGQSTQNVGVPVDVVVPSAFNSPEVGESTRPYALPTRTIPAFLSRTVNPGDAWKPLSDDTLKRLAARSKERVAANAEIAETQKKIKEAEAKKTVKIGELLAEGDGSEDEDKEDEDDKKLDAQALEALNVLVDLVNEQRS